MIHELLVPIPVITPKGKALAYFLLDYSVDHHLMWICFQDDTGECWTFANPEIRIQNNPTFNRNVKPLYNQQALNPELPSDPLPPPESENEWKYNYTKKSGLSEQ